MSRHITDHATPTAEGAGLKHFLDLARKEGVHPSVDTLSQRAPERAGRKVAEFLRIERSEAAAAKE